MKTEIVKYHNDLNQLIFPNFLEQELNVFNHLIVQMVNQKKEILEFTPEEVARFFPSNYTREEMVFMLYDMAGKMTAKSFKHISQKNNHIEESFIVMFPTFKVESERYSEDSITLKSLKVRVNPDFQYLFNEVFGNFTKYELGEFIDIKGKYTKRFYMLLKQYRDTGVCATYKNNWDDFCAMLNIPKDYEMRDIDKRILKPAIEELTKERTLFDQERIPFKNLKYEKIKGAGRGQGGKVIGIVFTFEPEPEVRVEFEEAQQKLEQQEQEQTQNDYFLDREALKKRLDVARYTSIYINGVSYKIEAVEPILYKTGDLVIAVSIRDEDLKPTSAQFNSEQEFIDWYKSVKE